MHNSKRAFSNQETVDKYAMSILDVGLWKSEEFLINKYVAKNSKILDLGCGTGRTTFWLYKLGWKNIKGVDISKEMINKCNEINQILKFDIMFYHQDATNLSFSDNLFDFVFFSFNGWPGIVNFKSRINALKEIYRVLKPGGIYIFTAHTRNELEYHQRYQTNFMNCTEFQFKEYGDYVFQNEEGFWDFMHLYSTNELRNLIKNHTNFEILEILERDKYFKESQKVLEFSDNTNFWILKK